MARFLTCSLLLIGTVLSAADTAPLRVPYTEFTLPNGLHVILHRDANLPVVSVNVWYHVGSANERPGRTGFAHLFEHLMFEGSKNVRRAPLTNGSKPRAATTTGRPTAIGPTTKSMPPANALELALFLESDRMGDLLEPMTPERVNGQRDVVKNERRQSYENAPYGKAFLALVGAALPAKSSVSRGRRSGPWKISPPQGYEDVGDVFQKPITCRTTPAWWSPATSTSLRRVASSRNGFPRSRAAPIRRPSLPHLCR